MVSAYSTFWAMGKVARSTSQEQVSGAIAALADPRDWADAAALMDTAIRIFADAIRPVLQNTDAGRLAPSNILLLLMMESRGAVKIADVIREGHLIASNATYALKALHRAGCIEHGSDPSDRRTKIVTLTPFGREVVTAVRKRCRTSTGTDWIRTCQNVVKNFEAGLQQPDKGTVRTKRASKAPRKPIQNPPPAQVPVRPAAPPLPPAAPPPVVPQAEPAPTPGRDTAPDMFSIMGATAVTNPMTKRPLSFGSPKRK